MLDLIERLEKAESGSRGLDGDIAATIRLQPAWATVHKPYQRELFTDGGPGTRAREWLAPKLTTSLDAIVALIGEKLPGWDVVIRIPSKPTFKHVCELGAPDIPAASITDPWPFRTSAGASSAPLAACSALLRALHTEEQRHR